MQKSIPPASFSHCPPSDVCPLLKWFGALSAGKQLLPFSSRCRAKCELQIPFNTNLYWKHEKDHRSWLLLICRTVLLPLCTWYPILRTKNLKSENIFCYGPFSAWSIFKVPMGSLSRLTRTVVTNTENRRIFFMRVEKNILMVLSARCIGTIALFFSGIFFIINFFFLLSFFFRYGPI